MKISCLSIILLTMAGAQGQITPSTSAEICSGGFLTSHPTFGTEDYGNSIDSEVTICPTVFGNSVVMGFGGFNTEPSLDTVTIYDSDNNSGNVLATLSGNLGFTGPYASTHPSGGLTIVWETDLSSGFPGFAAEVDCMGPTSSPTSSPTASPTASQCQGKGYTAQQCDSHGYRNRNLKAVPSRFLKEEHKECLNIHHDMFLVVEGVHFAGVAIPRDAPACPSVVFHSNIAHDKSIQKVVMIADANEVAEFDVSSMHHLGTQPMTKIVDAFEKAPVGKDGAKFYDSITNNCVALLRNMADPLDVKVDDAMIDFVSEKLLSTADINLWNGIKNSPSLSLLMEGGKRMLKAANQEELVRKLIKLYV